MPTFRIQMLTLVAALIGLVAMLAPAPAEPIPTSAPATVQTLSADLANEEWWTTTDCPPSVQVPCLDPETDPARVPTSVAPDLAQLVEQEWVCIDEVGVPQPDGTVRVEHDQLQLCRQRAYASLGCDPDTSCEALGAR